MWLWPVAEEECALVEVVLLHLNDLESDTLVLALKSWVSEALSTLTMLMIGTLGHIRLLDESMEFDVSESLCKAVCNHLVGWNVR